MAYTLRAARQAAGKTEAEMAGVLGISCEAYRALELHPETVTVEQARRFSQGTGISVDSVNFFTQYST